MEYKGYSGSVHQNKDGSYYGRVYDVRKELKYTGKTEENLEHAFQATIDEYLESKRSRRKTRLVLFVILIAVFGAMLVTCPDETDHKDKVNLVIKQGIKDSVGDDSLALLASMLGGGFMSLVVNEYLVVEDYYIISIGKFSYDDEERICSIGILGHVYTTFNKEEIAEILNNM